MNFEISFWRSHNITIIVHTLNKNYNTVFNQCPSNFKVVQINRGQITDFYAVEGKRKCIERI